MYIFGFFFLRFKGYVDEGYLREYRLGLYRKEGFFVLKFGDKIY